MNPVKKEMMKTVLLALEAELQAAALWDNEKTDSVKELQSDTPFASDILTPTQWLQWIFLPKMHHLIQSEQPLPCGYRLLPYFEEALKDCPSTKIFSLISQIDQLGQR